MQCMDGAEYGNVAEMTSGYGGIQARYERVRAKLQGIERGLIKR